MTAAYSGVVSKLLLDRDVLIRNTGVKGRLDWIGPFLNDFKAQWNAVNPANLITEADYDAKDYE